MAVEHRGGLPVAAWKPLRKRAIPSRARAGDLNGGCNDMRSSHTDRGDSARPPLPVVLWADIFALVDQGNALAGDYPVLERMVLEQGTKHPGGLGGLVIIPSAASPPPEEVRRAIREVI